MELDIARDCSCGILMKSATSVLILLMRRARSRGVTVSSRKKRSGRKPKKNVLKERVSCAKSWERRIMSKLPEIRKRVFPLLFLCARLHTLTHRIQTTHPLTFYFSTLFQFARLHTTQTTFYHSDYTTCATPKFCHLSKDLEKAAGSSRLPTSPTSTIEKRENAAGDYTAASNVSQTTYSKQQQQEQTTFNVPLQQQEQTTQGEQQQERGVAASNRLL